VNFNKCNLKHSSVIGVNKIDWIYHNHISSNKQTNSGKLFLKS